VLTKRIPDIRNSVPSSLFTQKTGAHKKGHLISVISNVFVFLVNPSLVLLTFGTRIPFVFPPRKNKWTTGNGWSQNRLLMSCINGIFWVVTKQTLDVLKKIALFSCYHRKRVVTKQTLDVLKKIGLFSCYHRKRVLTKKILDIRNSVPSSLFTQKTGAHKKGHLISLISNVFVFLVNRSLVLPTYRTF
jgi:hypothetical protein